MIIVARGIVKLQNKISKLESAYGAQKVSQRCQSCCRVRGCSDSDKSRQIRSHKIIRVKVGIFPPFISAKLSIKVRLEIYAGQRHLC